MDLWVRSQNRRALYKTSSLFIREELYKRKGRYIIEGNECWLGEYNTFERALEVLDDIETHIRVVGKIDTIDAIIYQMPKE